MSTGTKVVYEQTAVSKTILVVEDYDDTREMVRRFLEVKGYRVVEGVNGEQGLIVAMTERPDLILMDLKMPVIDGFTATRMIRELDDLGDVPVVAITADGSRGRDFYNNVDELGIGRIEYLSKPLDFDKLEQLLDSLLREA
ncbi:MAG TPA: response regulator [Pyrinomonadaceae bacterium]|jgi:two-component system cell cycle response regulator DivK|nr:response regulator [Pyrinomonadaceae bacterium]